MSYSCLINSSDDQVNWFIYTATECHPLPPFTTYEFPSKKRNNSHLQSRQDERKESMFQWFQFLFFPVDWKSEKDALLTKDFSSDAQKTPRICRCWESYWESHPASLFNRSIISLWQHLPIINQKLQQNNHSYLFLSLPFKNKWWYLLQQQGHKHLW